MSLNAATETTTNSPHIRDIFAKIMQPGRRQPVRQEFMENECEALQGVAYPGVRDNRSTLNTKTGYDDDDDDDDDPWQLSQMFL